MAPGGGVLDEADLKKPSVANGILPDVAGLYKWDEPSVSAVLLSHGHLDHYRNLRGWLALCRPRHLCLCIRCPGMLSRSISVMWCGWTQAGRWFFEPRGGRAIFGAINV